MSLVRPEAAAALSRWRDVLIGGAVLALGLYWLVFSGGLLRGIGVVVAPIGAVIAAAGVQRARFAQGGDAPGIVQVVEGRITYFGPLTGGVVDLDALSALTLDPTARPPHWLLSQSGQPDIAIPLGAQGADQLFDAFASLPGIRTEHMLRQMQGGADHPVVIWRKGPARPALPRLH